MRQPALGVSGVRPRPCGAGFDIHSAALGFLEHRLRAIGSLFGSKRALLGDGGPIAVLLNQLFREFGAVFERLDPRRIAFDLGL